MRTLRFALAALAAGAVLAPPSALAGGASHLLGSYKVERQLDLEGEGGTYTLACGAGDIAVDGMWRIDNVDQDNDYVYDSAPSGNAAWDVLNSVEPIAAYPSAIDTYTFRFLPLAGADAQGKLFLTCLPAQVRTAKGHQQSWIAGSVVTTQSSSVALPASPATYGNTGSFTTPPCPNDPSLGKRIAVSPGFNWETDDTWGKPYKRTPTPGSANRSWDWGFFSPTGGTVTVSWRCLNLLTDYYPGPAGHRHKLISSYKPKVSPPAATLGANEVSEVQVACGALYKAMVGAWDFGAGGAGEAAKYDGYAWLAADNAQKLWFLGMDPRPKVRAFKVLNTALTGAPAMPTATTTKFGAICFKDRAS